MDLSVLTNTIIDAPTVGSVPNAQYEPASAKRPLAEDDYETRVDQAYYASADNSSHRVSEKTTDRPEQDFDRTLEQQIRKNSPQDEKPASEVRSDGKEPSASAEPEKKAQEPTNTPSSGPVEKPATVSNETGSSPAAAKISKTAATKAGLDSLPATSPTPKAPESNTTQAGAVVPTTKTNNVEEKSQGATSGLEQLQAEAKQPVQKAQAAATSAKDTAAVTEKAVTAQTSKDNPQGSQVSQAGTQTKATQTTTQTDLPKTDTSEVESQPKEPTVPDGAQATPQISQFEAQPKTNQVVTDKQVSNTDQKSDAKDADVSDLSDAESGPSDNKASAPTENLQVDKSVVAEAQTTASQNIKQTETTSKDDAESGVDQVIPNGSAPTTGSGRTSPAAQTVKPAGGNQTPSESADVARQVQESFSTAVRQGEQQITIRLNPPELGSVQMSIKEQGDQITGLLEVTEMQTRAEIQQTLPQIVRNLQDMGIDVKRLDVTLVSEQDHHASMGQTLTEQRENWNGGDGSGNGGTQAEESNWFQTTGWLPGSNGYTDAQGAYASYVTDSSINMLV